MRIVLLSIFLISVNIYGQMNNDIIFKKKKIEIDNTKYEKYIGTVTVKIDRSNPNSKQLTLPVQIIKSPAKSPKEPIYWFEGGPGQSNMKFVPSPELLANHDFVSIGYRGTDGSIILKSKKIDKAMKGLNHKLLSEKSLDYLCERLKNYSEKLKKEGIDFNHFTMMDVIDDFEEIRKKLGHEKINLLSASYGTRVALIYSYRHAETIYRSIMVGANPPGCFVWQPEATKRIIQTYDSIYQTQTGNTGISIAECISQAFERMPKRWSLFRLDADKIKTCSFLLLFQKSSAVMVFDAYKKAALNGDYSGLYLMQLAYDYVGLFVKFNYGDLFSKAASADYNPALDYRVLLKPAKNEIGAPYSLLLWGIAKSWPIQSIPDEFRKPQNCNTQTLIVSGNLDISTPSENATLQLLPFMPNAKQVVLKDMAHVGDLMWLQKDAFNQLVTSYFDRGEADTSKFSHDNISFTTKKSFSKMAKVYYPIVLILSIFK